MLITKTKKLEFQNIKFLGYSIRYILADMVNISEISSKMQNQLPTIMGKMNNFSRAQGVQFKFKKSAKLITFKQFRMFSIV